MSRDFRWMYRDAGLNLIPGFLFLKGITRDVNLGIGADFLPGLIDVRVSWELRRHVNHKIPAI